MSAVGAVSLDRGCLDIAGSWYVLGVAGENGDYAFRHQTSDSVTDRGWIKTCNKQYYIPVSFNVSSRGAPRSPALSAMPSTARFFCVQILTPALSHFACKPRLRCRYSVQYTGIYIYIYF